MKTYAKILINFSVDYRMALCGYCEWNRFADDYMADAIKCS